MTPPRAALLALAAFGCSPDKPKAPPLTNEAVYQNDKIGLRFLTPEGWQITARTDLPPGQLPRPVTLVAYVLNFGGKASDLEVTAADLPADTDLAKFFSTYQVGADRWAVKPAEAVSVNGVAAERFVMTPASGKGPARREATAFRRDGGRVYFFIVSYPATDPDRRDQARKCVESVAWSK